MTDIKVLNCFCLLFRLTRRLRNKRVNDSLGSGMVRKLNFDQIAQGCFRKLNFSGLTTFNERGTLQGAAVSR